jgi:enoyl-CoA hydratase/carnithine racemase
MSEHVLISQADGVCELRLNRPEKRNAITLAMYEALWAGMVQAEGDDSVRVILISGAGAGFSAGNDLNDFLAGPPVGDDHPTLRFVRLLPKIRKILVAAVHGAAVGVGTTLLLHCDLVIAGSSARLSMPFVNLGLVPEAASSLLLPRLVGHQRAAELLLLGTAIDAQTALNLGLVNRIVADDKLLEEARGLALAVAAKPAGAVRATKQLLRSETGVATRLEEELRVFQERLGSVEFKNAAQAFFQKGRPG